MARLQPRGLATVLAVLAIVAVVAGGVVRARVDTGIASFVPRGDDTYDQLTQRDDDFGGDPVVVLLRGRSQNGLFLDADQLTRLVALEGRLAQLPDVAVVYGPGTVLNQTATAIRHFLLQMSGRRDAIENTARAQARSESLSPDATRARVRTALATFDARYGALVAQGLPMGLPTLRNQKFVASVLLGSNGEPRPEWRFLVPTAKSATLLVRPAPGLDQEQAAELVEAVHEEVDAAGLTVDEPVVTGVPALTSALSERATAEVPRLGLAALAAVGLVFLLMPWSRRRRDRLRPLVPAALGTATTVGLFGWLDRPMSLGVVAFLPIVLGIGSDFPLYLSQPTQRRRILVAAGAGVAAFSLMAVSELPFVREFGIALAVAVAATVGWALLLRSRLSEVEPAASAEPQDAAAGRGVRPARALLVAGILAAVVGWALLPGLTIESRPDSLARGLPELGSVERAERVLGFTGEISVVARGDDVLEPEVLAWARDAESRLVRAHGDELRPLLTMGRLLEFLGARATPEQVEAGASLLPPYLLNAVVTGDRTASSSTYGVVLDDVEEQRALIDDVRELVPPPPDGYEADVVGLPVVATSGLSAMSASRYLIGLLGLGVGVLVIGLGLRSVRIALMAGAASLLSAGWVYAGLALAGQDLNPLTLAVGALITVTACEFTVMLDAARAERWLRRSVVTAATAGTVGYLCLALSELAILREFGLVLAAGVVSSFAASWLVTAVTGRRSRTTATPVASPGASWNPLSSERVKETI